jgi:type II secretory pathway pseudopilin PulG
MNYRNKNILFGKRYRPLNGGLSLMEIIIALSIITIIFAAIFPLFGQIRNSWDSKQAAAETLQNGRILIDHMTRNLAKAVKVTAVSISSDISGYIEFQDNDAAIFRYDVNSATDYVEYGSVGSLSDLAGPVSQLRFICYDACDLDVPLDISTADVNDIRFVKAETIFDSSSPGQEKTLVASAYLRTGSSSESGLVAWWKLDESSGLTATDSSNNGNNGILMNMVGDEWIGGAVGGALNFDENNDYVAIQNLHYDSGGHAEITVTAWIRTDSSGNQIIASYDRNEYWRLEINGSGAGPGQIGWDVYTSTGQVDYGSTTRVDDGAWHHVAAVFDNGTMIIYIDGNPETPASGGSTFGRGTRTRYGFLGVGSEATSFDGNKNPTNYFDGDMDDVRIYNRALSAAEISRLAETLRFREYRDAKVTSGDTSITIQTPPTDEGDLLIATIATDGDASLSLAPPMGEGWTQIDLDDYSNQVTLGAWWKLADASESSSHQFTWSGSRQAYGWMMSFAGQDSADPIDDYAGYGESDSTPTSPAVTTTVNNSLILRLGAFDGGDIIVGDPGLSDHTAITMDKSTAVLFEDGFETSFDKWTDDGYTDWERSSSVTYSGNWSAWADKWDNDLISDNIDTSTYNSFTIEFWYRVEGTESSDNIYLQLYNGGGYVNYYELGTATEGTWLPYEAVITDAQYCRSNFRIKFEASDINSGNEGLWIDDVMVGSGGVSGGAGYAMQSSSGSSGTSSFSLESANEARTLTIAISPADNGGSVSGIIRP